MTATNAFSLPRVTPLGAYSAGPSGVRAVARLVAGYGGPCVRVVRAWDGAETDLGFGADGRLDLQAARDFAGGPGLVQGVLHVGTWYDQAGGCHLQGTAGAHPSLCSERDAYGGNFADTPFVMQDGAKDFYPVPLGRALIHPEGFRRNPRDMAAFLVARPTVSVSGNAWLRLGGVSLLTRDADGAAPAGLVLSQRMAGSMHDHAGGAGDITFVPRVNRHCLALVARPQGYVVLSEERTTPPLPLPGGDSAEGIGGVGATDVSGFYATNDLYASVDYPAALGPAEARAVMRVLSATFDTAMRANRFIADGSSTPRGQGADGNVCYPKLMQAHLDRPVDVFNIAVNGYTLGDLIERRGERAMPLIEPGRNCVYCPDGLSNSIARGVGAASLFAALEDHCRAMGAAGARVVVPTVKNRGDLGPHQQAERARLNELIRNGWRKALGADGLLDVDGIPETRDAHDTRYFQPDLVHNRTPIHRLIGELAAKVVQPLLV